MASNKPHMNLVFIGHVDHGKSTTVGRLLFETKSIDPHIIEEYRKKAEEIGKATFEFAWVMDNLKEERERGVTIDVAHKKFESNKYYFTIIDAPGHRDFVKNMITGTSQADAAVLVVSGKDGPQAQTKEHMFLAKTLGVNQMIVAINKMDATEPPYSEEVFNKRKDEMIKLLKTVGYKDDQILVIPISALAGDNVVEKGKLSWFKGPTLMEAMDQLKEPEKPTNLPLRLPIQDVYSITGAGTVPVGRVETGIMKPGDKIIVLPSSVPGGAKGDVKSIEMHHEQIPQAVPGDNVGFNVRGIGKKDIKRGDVVGHLDNPEKWPTVAKLFTAQIVVLQHPNVISVGYTPVFHCHTAQVACKFEELLKKLDPKTGQVKEENPSFIKPGDIAIVKVRPTKPMVLENAKEIPQLGRFAIRDMGMTVAAGMCISVDEKMKT